MMRCEVCFRHCNIEEGGTGFCGARIGREGEVVAGNYGRLTAIALDPIEKKPLNRFYPGTRILSVGSYGCNLRCPFCQNAEISWSEEALRLARENLRYMSPKELARLASDCRDKGNIGVAFTYNEPLVGYEYVRDAAKEVRQLGMKTVMVTNGTAELSVLEKLLPYIDGMNIDLKGFQESYYREVLGGDRQCVLDFISEAVRHCHVELTTLIVPGYNDDPEEMKELARWIEAREDGRGNRVGRKIPLHISRFFPRFHEKDRPATDVRTIHRLVRIAREHLDYVYPGNC